MGDDSILIVGANGQLGKALQRQYPQARAVDIDSLDISNSEAVRNFDWKGISTILNAAAYTNVDGAETAEGRGIAWSVNAGAVRNLTKAALENDLVIVHISTDYVFDGTKDSHTEDESLSPLSVYGASKAAGDVIVSLAPKHYILRTSWVIGDGKNFVRTMLDLGHKGINPSVVADQIGRLTFTSELVSAIGHLLNTQAPFGTYNVTNDGQPASWADIARRVYQVAGMSSVVTDQTSLEYFKTKPGSAPRPLYSTLNLKKIIASGFKPQDWDSKLQEYVKQEIA